MNDLQDEEGDALPQELIVSLKDVVRCVVNQDYACIGNRNYNGRFTVDQTRGFIEDNFSFYPANYVEPSHDDWTEIIRESAVKDIDGNWIVACPLSSDPPTGIELTLTILFLKSDAGWTVEIHDLKA